MLTLACSCMILAVVSCSSNCNMHSAANSLFWFHAAAQVRRLLDTKVSVRLYKTLDTGHELQPTNPPYVYFGGWSRHWVLKIHVLKTWFGSYAKGTSYINNRHRQPWQMSVFEALKWERVGREDAYQMSTTTNWAILRSLEFYLHQRSKSCSYAACKQT